MNTASDTIIDALQAAFPDAGLIAKPLMADRSDAQMAVHVAPQHLMAVATFLRDDERASMEQLCDLTCVDYLEFPDATDRYGVTYALLSVTQGHRLWLKCFTNDPEPAVPSVVSVWPGADWLEREVYDMFGVVFSGHPDLRRILTWDGFEAHPLRKDYPLRGRGEREDYNIVTRDSA